MLNIGNIYSQQPSVEDPEDSITLQAVEGSAALAFLEGILQPLDPVPLAKVLQRKQRISHKGNIESMQNRECCHLHNGY